MWINKDIYTKQKAHKSTTVHMTSHLTHYYIFFFFPKSWFYNKEVQRLSHMQSSRAALYKTVQIKCSSSKYWTSAAFLLFTFKWSVKLFTVNRTSHQIHEAVLCHYHRSYLSKLSLNSYCEKTHQTLFPFTELRKKGKEKKEWLK